MVLPFRLVLSAMFAAVDSNLGTQEVVFPNSIIGPVLEVKLWGRTRDTSRAKEASPEAVW